MNTLESWLRRERLARSLFAYQAGISYRHLRRLLGERPSDAGETMRLAPSKVESVARLTGIPIATLIEEAFLGSRDAGKRRPRGRPRNRREQDGEVESEGRGERRSDAPA